MKNGTSKVLVKNVPPCCPYCKAGRLARFGSRWKAFTLGNLSQSTHAEEASVKGVLVFKRGARHLETASPHACTEAQRYERAESSQSTACTANLASFGDLPLVKSTL